MRKKILSRIDLRKQVKLEWKIVQVEVFDTRNNREISSLLTLSDAS